MDVGREVCANSFFGDRELRGPLGNQRVDVLKAVVAGLYEILRNNLIQRSAPRSGAPDSGDKGKSGEGAPFFRQIVIDKFFARALEAVGAFFQGQEGWVADENGRVRKVEHGVEVGGRGLERNSWIAPLVEED